MDKKIRIWLSLGHSFIYGGNMSYDELINKIRWDSPSTFTFIDDKNNRHSFHSSDIKHIEEVDE